MTKPLVDAAARRDPRDRLDPVRVTENWPESEQELFREVVQAVRTIRYGSIVLTIHNGQIVEVGKNIRIRRNSSGEKE